MSQLNNTLSRATGIIVRAILDSFPHTHTQFKDRCPHDSPVYRTKLCYFYKQGRCRWGHQCTYAHDDVSNVAICECWNAGKICSQGELRCPYLHPNRLDERQRPPENPFPKVTNLSQHRETDTARFERLNNIFNNKKPTRNVLPWTKFSQDAYDSMREEAVFYEGESKNEKEFAADAVDAEAYYHHLYAARIAETKSRNLHAEASQALFESCNPDYPSADWIDLHGQHVEEALQYIHHWLARYPLNQNIVYIVTGAGHHSLTTPKLRPAVKDYLEKRFWVRECSVDGDVQKAGGAYVVWFCVHSFYTSTTGNTTCKHCKWIKTL